jgi:hypothetical protein
MNAQEILQKAYSQVSDSDTRIKLVHALLWLQGKYYRPSRSVQYTEGDNWREGDSL